MRLEAFLDDAVDEARTGRDTARVVAGLAKAAIAIAELIRRDGIGGELGAARGSTNSDGDAQKELDVVADEVIARHLAEAGAGTYLSEERGEPVGLGPEGGLTVAADPLDGSSNIGVNATVGTIFSVLPAGGELQAGRNQLAAGFFAYGPQTTLIVAFAEGGCQSFAADPDAGGFVAIGEPARIPEEADEFAINAAYANHWFAPVREWMEAVLAGAGGPYGKPYRMRWAGSLVADAWRIFQRGGVFLYPGDSREGNAQGRLRLVYEANPIAHLAERAGGMATDGAGPILDIEPESLHQRVPLFFGSRQEVQRLVDLHRKHGGTPPES